MPANDYEHDDNCIFCKIAKKEEKAYLIWEDETHMAFLSIFPNTPGVTVVIPKKHHPSYAFELDAQNLFELTCASKKVAGILDAALPNTMRTGLVFEGFGVNHVHAKLFPLHGPKIEQWQPIKSNVRTWFNEYPGYISSHDGEPAPKGELKAIQYTLTRAFHKSLRLSPLAWREAVKLHSKQECLDDYQKDSSITFGIWLDKDCIGAISAHKIQNTNNAVINYWLKPNFTGRGIATAGVKTILDYAFLTLGLDTIFVRCQQDNDKARAVAQRLMFGEPMQLKSESEGSSRPFIEYSMHNSSWLTLQTDTRYDEISILDMERNIPDKSFFTAAYTMLTRNKIGFAALGAAAFTYALVHRQKIKPI